MEEKTINRPHDRVQDGELTVSLWRQNGQHGDYLTSSGVRKIFRDNESGEVRETSRLSVTGEHLRAAKLLERAADRIRQFREANRRQQQVDRSRSR